MLCMGLCAWRGWGGSVLPTVWRHTAIYGFQFRIYASMVMSRDQNAGRSYNMKIDNSSFERVEEFET